METGFQMERAEVSELGQFPTVKEYIKAPSPPPNGAVLQTKFCGICHSDLHLWENTTSSSKFPIIYGHEVSGTILSFGENADSGDLKIGERVMVYPWIGCGNCNNCDSGQHHLCMDRSQETGCGADGGYSSLVYVKDPIFLVRVPDTISMDVACMLPCSGLTSYSAVIKAKKYLEKNQITAQAHALVIGAGGLGLWCLQCIKLCLPNDTVVVCVDISQEKLDVALKHGADESILWSIPRYGQTIVDHTVMSEFEKTSQGHGFDFVLDFVNSTVTAERGFAALKKNGFHVAVGLFGGSFTINLPSLVRSQKTIAGSYTGSLQELHELVELVRTSKIISPPITHYALHDVADAWRLLNKGNLPGRGIIKY